MNRPVVLICRSGNRTLEAGEALRIEREKILALELDPHSALEARREIGRGNIATVLVQAGNLKVGDVFFAGSLENAVAAHLSDPRRAAKIIAAAAGTFSNS